MIASGQLDSALAAIYTLPASKVADIKTIIFHNTNSVSEVVTVCVVPNGGTADVTNQILNIALESGATFEFSPAYPFVLNVAGQNLQAKSTTESKVNFWILGQVSNV